MSDISLDLLQRKKLNEKSENGIVCGQAILSGTSTNVGPHRFCLPEACFF